MAIVWQVDLERITGRHAATALNQISMASLAEVFHRGTCFGQAARKMTGGDNADASLNITGLSRKKGPPIAYGFPFEGSLSQQSRYLGSGHCHNLLTLAPVFFA